MNAAETSDGGRIVPPSPGAACTDGYRGHRPPPGASATPSTGAADFGIIAHLCFPSRRQQGGSGGSPLE